MSPKALRSLLRALREFGVTSYECEGVKLVLGQLPTAPVEASASPTPARPAATTTSLPPGMTAEMLGELLWHQGGSV